MAVGRGRQSEAARSAYGGLVAGGWCHCTLSLPAASGRGLWASRMGACRTSQPRRDKCLFASVAITKSRSRTARSRRANHVTGSTSSGGPVAVAGRLMGNSPRDFGREARPLPYGRVSPKCRLECAVRGLLLGEKFFGDVAKVSPTLRRFAGLPTHRGCRTPASWL